MTKTIKVQKDQYGQPIKIVLELKSGMQANIPGYIRFLISTQDWSAWRDNPEGFRDWIAESVARYIKGLDLKIWGYSPDASVNTKNCGW